MLNPPPGTNPYLYPTPIPSSLPPLPPLTATAPSPSQLHPQSPGGVHNPFARSAHSILNRTLSNSPLPNPYHLDQPHHLDPHHQQQPDTDMTARTRRASSRTATGSADQYSGAGAGGSYSTRRSSRGASAVGTYNEDALQRDAFSQAYAANAPPPVVGTRRSGRHSGAKRYADDDDASFEQDDGDGNGDAPFEQEEEEEEDAEGEEDEGAYGQGAYGQQAALYEAKVEEADQHAQPANAPFEQGQPQEQLQGQMMMQPPPQPPRQQHPKIKVKLRIPDDEEDEEEAAQPAYGNGSTSGANGYGGSQAGPYGPLPPLPAGFGESPAQNGTAPEDSYGDAPDPGAAGDGDYQDEDGGDGVRGRSLRPRRGRIAPSTSEEDDDYGGHVPQRVVTTTASGRTTKRPIFYGEDDEEEKPANGGGGRRGLRRGGGGGGSGGYGGDYVDQDEDFDAEDSAYGGRRETRSRRSTRGSDRAARQSHTSKPSRPKTRQTRNSRRASAADQSYEGGGSSDVSTDEEMLDLANTADEDDESVYGGDRGGTQPKRQLRNKPRVNYFVPLQLEQSKGKEDKKGKGKMRRTDEDGNPFAGLPANMTGAQWAALYPEGGQPSDSSDDDDLPNSFNSPRKNALFSGPGANLTGGGGGMLAAGGVDFGAGAPGNLGKVGGAAALADTDPLGVPSTVSFDSVGGLGQHIQQLKEMVSLPLLYPEVFERFAITPPRGVLFHGPPGTGKTLLARALAASCSTEGRKISFFMRKGADCLSKWVGEAERQLRLLFEEARACQPSIIFFDEIDGLAPVRSSKQEQIHASIVSTLLALMDGMDGRGQVIVIGATNRPDAIDPALRRPGRFDREFYFPLPNLEARRKILEIHTKGWEPGLDAEFLDELAKLTKGYGGADLRALCTEAALNAVQRTYPQIYKTNDRLLIKPETIGASARDFVLAQKNLIPSTARSTSSTAAPLPPQLVPLLSDALDNAKEALAKVLPETKKISILEDAEYVDEGGGFEKEKMMQAFETLRVFRPRLLICGEPGTGQSYIGAAVLHHLEGFHVQTLDLATLVSDSTRTMEAACVQLFVEAKRHKPSILFIPQLETWCASVGETVRATVKGLLDGLDPSDPILLLAVVDGPVKDVPADVRSWFGFVKGNRVVLGKPGPDQRRDFFADVLAGIRRPPNEYPDALPRRKRVLEKLPIAPPPPPREPTAAELAQQAQSDLRLLEYLKWKLGPVLAELKKRYKRFTRSYYRDWQSDDLEWRQEQLRKGETVTGLGTQPYHNVDLDSMHSDLYKGYYYTPDDFVTDVLRIQHNAEVNKIMENDAEAPVRAGQMVNHTKVMLDQTFDPAFRASCEAMAVRMKEKKGADKDKRKGKGGDVADEGGVVAAAKEAAVAGGLNARRSNGPTEVDDEVQILEGGGDGTNGTAEGDAEQASLLKRARDDGEDGEAMEGVEGGEQDGQGPAKRPRQEGSDPSAAAVDLADGQLVASGSGGAGAGLVTGGRANGPSPAPATASLNDLLNPTTNSSLLGFAPTDAATHFSDAPAQSNPFIAAAVPALMPVGAVPSISPHPLTNTAAIPVPGVPPPPTGSVSFLSGAVPAPAASAVAADLFSPSSKANGLVVANGGVSREVTPTPTMALNRHGSIVPDSQPAHGQEGGEVPAGAEEGTAPAASASADGEQPPAPSPEKERTPTPMEATPPPLPDFLLPSAAVDALESFLADGTGPLNVDQLEQLRAACFDAVWRGRAEWDRARMVSEIDELAREFVEEVEALA
ncbi:hypothetical protein JCM10213_008781 [Rhodosporidiobolus nylandii]